MDLPRAWAATLGPALPPGSPAEGDACAVLGWAASGAMALTGHPDRPPVASPAPAFGLLADVLDAFARLSGLGGTAVRADPALLLAGRAGLLGLRRAGRVSAGGAARLLRARDGWCAVSLARTGDVEAVPAILGEAVPGDPWRALADAAAARPARDLADRAQLLGVPAAALPLDTPAAGVPWRATRLAPPSPRATLAGALVVDLSSMWAGPLAAHLLGRAGARIVKVESTERPDGARRGDPRFFEWLHAGHDAVSLDFRSARGRSELAGLLDAADVVIEASRPRALAQLGLAPGTRPHPDGQVWLSITGHGRGEPDRVAFGDDAAVGGGLVGWDGDEPVFCADAAADPLTGICGAFAVAGAVLGGGGTLLDLSMRATAAAFAGAPAVGHGPHPVHADGAGWVVECARSGRAGAVAAPPVPC